MRLTYREPDYVDELAWYRIQHMGRWFAVKSCCRRCATKNLHAWINECGNLKTNATPDWLFII